MTTICPSGESLTEVMSTELKNSSSVSFGLLPKDDVCVQAGGVLGNSRSTMEHRQSLTNIELRNSRPAVER